jgi:hypothetical protein
MPSRKAGRIPDSELARLRRRGASLRALAEASGLSRAAVSHRLLAAMGASAYHVTRGYPSRVLSERLEACGVRVNPEAIGGWTGEQRRAASEWASDVRRRRSPDRRGHPRTPPVPRPDFLPLGL